VSEYSTLCIDMRADEVLISAFSEQSKLLNSTRHEFNWELTRALVGFQNSVTGLDLGFYAARSYSLMRPPRMGWRLSRSWERSAGG
jgi:hypothetical protein